MSRTRPAFWSKRGVGSFLLWPMSLLFRMLAFLRRLAYKSGLLSSWRSPLPVVVVGNITVGGAGKTPLVIALSHLLSDHGYKAGIVTRGYGGTVSTTPMLATDSSNVSEVGDEAVLLARRTGVPVMVSTSRVAAVQRLIATAGVDCVLCDDGLQHYALKRDLEIAVVDATYQFGNRFCLPAGPLREPVSRLKSVDLTVFSGASRDAPGYTLTGSDLVRVNDDTNIKPIDSLAGARVHAIAGIASPEKFFEYLRENGLDCVPHPFGDHAEYKKDDLLFDDDLPVVMTEKDMVKCRGMQLPNTWYVPVTAKLDAQVASDFLNYFERLRSGRNDIAH